MALHDDFNKAALRTLENPPARIALPPHLAKSVSYLETGKLTRAIREGIAASGLEMSNIKRLNVAWPHKHAHSGHKNAATPHAESLREILYKSFRNTEITLAHSIYETVKLGRSENSSALHTLSQRQLFAVDPKLQADEPLPFLTNAGAKGECFILTDWIISQGTTIANLASFIMHNGGHVVAIAPPFGDRDLIQTDNYIDEDVPGVERRGALPPLGRAFARAATGEDNYSPAECLTIFEEALRKNGLSLSTLTDGECVVLANTMGGRGSSFRDFVNALGVPPEQQQSLRAAHQLKNGTGPA